MNLHRRELLSFGLSTAGLSLSARAMPPLVARWFGRQDPLQRAHEAREAQLRAAVAAARAQGKPLLVLMVPDWPLADATSSRGTWFGAFLNFGGSQALLEVSLFVLACGTRDELARAVGDVKFAADVPMALVDVPPEQGSEKGLVVTPVEIELGPFELQMSVDGSGKLSSPGLDKLSGRLTDARQKHRPDLADLAEQALEAMTREQRDRLAKWIDGGDAPEDELVVRGAAEVRRRAGMLADGRRLEVLEHLLGAVQRAVVQKPVPGARWMVRGGCGIPQPEGGEALMIGCGMAYSPPLAKRFLDFYRLP